MAEGKSGRTKPSCSASIGRRSFEPRKLSLCRGFMDAVCLAPDADPRPRPRRELVSAGGRLLVAGVQHEVHPLLLAQHLKRDLPTLV